jgi:hypothetical protein
MQVDYKIVQDRYGTRLIYEFGADKLFYSFRDASGERRVPISYETVDVTSPASITIDNREFIQRMLLVPLALWVSSTVLATVNPATSRILFDIAAGLGVFLLVSKFFGGFAITFCELPLTSQPSGAADLSLRIIRNKSYDIVLAEVSWRWKARMKEIHGAVDFSNEPDRELDKFRWLKLHEVIDEAEFIRIAEQLRTYATLRARPLPSEGTLN